MLADLHYPDMLGFELTFWDYATFASLAILGLGFLGFMVWLAGLPGRIAIARKHPEAEAVKLLGWAGILPTIYPWIQALIWSIKPTNVVDIRRFPREEAREIDEAIARLSGQDENRPAKSHSKHVKHHHDKSVTPEDPESNPGETLT